MSTLTADDSNIKLKLALTITDLSYAALLIAFCVWQFTGPAEPLFVILAIQVLPLLLFLPGIIKHHIRAYLWLCFAILVYFIKGVLGVAKAQPDWMDYTLLSMSVVIFIGAMMSSRWLRTTKN